MEKQIGKNTLGGGKKMSIDLKTYNRSTHNLSRIFRSSMSVGTLVPCLVDVMTPGDVWDMQLNSSVLTLPTVGPLFGSYKLQVDVFTCPIRLYVRDLHNNKLGVGLNMQSVKLPMFKAPAPKTETELRNFNVSDTNEFPQIEPSCLLNYLGIKGWGSAKQQGDIQMQDRCAIPVFAYYDIFKNFYANTQEENFYIVGYNNANFIIKAIQGAYMAGRKDTMPNGNIWTYYAKGTGTNFIELDTNSTKISESDFKNYCVLVMKEVQTNERIEIPITDLLNAGMKLQLTASSCKLTWSEDVPIKEGQWIYVSYTDSRKQGVSLDSHKLEDIDTLRELLLTKKTVVVDRDNTDGMPQFIQNLVTYNDAAGALLTKNVQYGLAVKTHQSDIFNNWVNTETIEGENGINAISAVSTAEGEFTIDALNLAEKIYTMLMRVAVSGGTYKDYIQVSYTTDFHMQAETPVYEGGLSADIEFQEVVSTAATNDPLGTLAGRGKLTNQRNGRLQVKVWEPSFIMAIASITPYCDYSQGNEWFTRLSNMAEIHVPQLDGIGFQDLMLDKIAWWADPTKSAGKQPAWIDYMTSFNRVHGNFAINSKNGFMVLNRIYKPKNETNPEGEADKKIIENLTSYINPEEFNYIFAEADIEAQNFWVQIGFSIQGRRVMSAAQIPNL